MGASNYDVTFKKSLSQDQIDKWFKKQQKIDRAYNGHREGYSEDTNTIIRIDKHENVVFKSEVEALKYCLENSVKWEIGVAVDYAEIEDTVKIKKLKEQVRLLQKKISEEENKQLNKKSKRKTVISFWAAC